MDASEDLRAQRFLRIAAIVVGCLAYWRLLFWGPSWHPGLLTTWFFFPDDPFPQLIFLVTAALVYRRREFLRSAMRSRGSPALAALPLLAGASLFVWGHYVSALDLVLVSFLLLAIGVSLLWFGVGLVRALAIPCVVLAFAFPVPGVVTNQVIYVIRLWTATHAASLMQLVGMPVLREGNVIIGATTTAQVIDSCSGLRSMQILTLAAVFFVGWFPARRLRKVLLVILAPAIAYLFNLLRVGAITVAPTSEFSTAHAAQGMTIFFGAISCLIVADRIFGYLLPGKEQTDAASRPVETGVAEEQPPQPEIRSEPSGAGESESATPRRGLARVRGRLGAASLVALAATLLGISIWMPRWSPPESERLIPARLPAELDGWVKTEKVPIDNGYLWTVRFSKHDYWIYERDGDEISVFIGYDHRRNRAHSLLSPKNAVPRRGWEIEERSSVSLESVEAQVERVVARSLSAQILAFHWYEGTLGLASETLRALLALDQSPFRRPQPARVIRVATTIAPGPIERAEGEARLEEFASSLFAALRE